MTYSIFTYRQPVDAISMWLRATYHTFCLTLLFCLSTLLIGCSVKPRPVVDISLQPVISKMNAKIDSEIGAVTVQQKGVAVTLEPLNEVELFELTEAPELNPYLVVEKGGAVEPLYTVFEITVHNRENERVIANDTAVLIDAEGAQYAALPYAYFESLYDGVDSTVFDEPTYVRSYSPYYRHRYFPYYQNYIDYAALEGGRAVVEESIFTGAKLFRGAKRRGLLIFERLDYDATDVSVVVKGLEIISADDKPDKLEFKFDFKQVAHIE